MQKQENFSKGQQVAVVGRIQTRNWDDDQEQKHYATEIIAEEVYFAGDKKGSAESTEQTENSDFETFSGDDLPF